MTLFAEYSSTMRAQDGGKAAVAYVIDVDLGRRIRNALLNSDGDDIEAEFLLDNLKKPLGQLNFELDSFIAHHLYDYLQGHKL